MNPSLIIGSAFTLAGFALLLLQVLAVDCLRAYRAICEQVEADLGHDTLVCPDYSP